MAENIALNLEQSFGELNECVVVTDRNRKILFVNKALADLLKVSRDDLIGTTTENFFADKTKFEELGELYNSPNDQRHRKAYSFDIRTGEGDLIPVEVVSAPLFDADHQLTGILFFARDQSERIALETRAKNIAETLEDALEAISEGFAIYDADDNLIICNENYKEIYAPSAPAMYPGNDFEAILRYGLERDQYDTGSLSNEEWLADRLDHHKSADGSVIEQSLSDGRWLRISETKTRNGGTAGIRADITELKTAKAQAESAYRDLSLIADIISCSITEVDLDGRCVFINKKGCEWFDGTLEELVGTRLRDRLPWKEREQVRSCFQKSYSGQRASEEICFHFPDGITRECQFESNPRFDEAGNVCGLVVMIVDNTDKKKTERTLAELYAITSTNELCYEDKIAEILRLGCEHMDLPFGIISHVIDDHYSVTHAHCPESELEPGMTFPLEDTYCTLTLQADRPLATAQASRSEFAKHPCFKVFGLETYIGAPLLVDGEVYGTINFTAPDTRKRPFSSADIQIIRQFADWVGHEIARDRAHNALMQAKVNLERIASVDDLTAILNRRAFLEAANTEVQRFRRSKRPFTAVMIDIDNFKLINDRNGHAVGDDVLKKFTEIIGGALRAVDVFGRVGGEEFCMILHNTSMEDAMLVSERLRQKIVDECQFDDIEQTITCSMGLAVVVREDVEFSTLMQRADMALYNAKSTGRNKCVEYSSGLDVIFAD
ncbi:sensor domain-containing diguanylate cyclase [Roseibium sp.]|uniref:sensor domain-containing diguanylate cyclase n=1 Tax=Roseibium sp. TaxID=1936156 RepID=UPI003B523890